MIGTVQKYDGSNGTVMNLDSGNQVYGFGSSDVSGSVSAGMVVRFDADSAMGHSQGYAKAVNVRQFDGKVG